MTAVSLFLVWSLHDGWRGVTMRVLNVSGVHCFLCSFEGTSALLVFPLYTVEQATGQRLTINRAKKSAIAFLFSCSARAVPSGLPYTVCCTVTNMKGKCLPRRWSWLQWSPHALPGLCLFPSLLVFRRPNSGEPNQSNLTVIRLPSFPWEFLGGKIPRCPDLLVWPDLTRPDYLYCDRCEYRSCRIAPCCIVMCCSYEHWRNFPERELVWEVRRILPGAGGAITCLHCWRSCCSHSLVFFTFIKRTELSQA